MGREDKTAEISVRFYGRLADAFGPTLALHVPLPCHVGDLREMVARSDQTLAPNRVRACVGDSFVPEDHPIGRGDVVEFLPPVSGG